MVYIDSALRDLRWGPEQERRCLRFPMTIDVELYSASVASARVNAASGQTDLVRDRADPASDEVPWAQMDAYSDGKLPSEGMQVMVGGWDYGPGVDHARVNLNAPVGVNIVWGTWQRRAKMCFPMSHGVSLTLHRRSRQPASSQG